MTFNLNDNSLMNGGTKVFNNGIAGVVKNVKVSVGKKTAEEMQTAPDYKVFITDDNGAAINAGFYYYTPNDSLSKEENDKKAGYGIGRILSIARSVTPQGFTFPDVAGKSVNEITDILFQIIRDNSEGKLVNVFASYGKKTKPSQYLGLRYFEFIEPAGVEPSRLKAKGDDLLERLTEDAPSGEQKGEPTLNW